MNASLRKPFKGGSPGPAVTGGDSCSEGCWVESQNRILDGNFSHLFVVKIVMSDVLLYSISVFVEAK